MKIQKIVLWTFTGVPVLLSVMSAMAKFSGAREIVDNFTKAHLIAYINYLGIAELLFAILFVIPATSRLGFLLMTGYFAGATAVELSQGGSMVMPILMLVFLFAAAWLRFPGMFFKPREA